TDDAGVIVKEPSLPTLEEIKSTELKACKSEVSEETDKQLPVWAGLKLKLQQGLQNAGRFYQEAVSEIGEAIGIANSEPFWNGYLNRWHVAVNFACGCKSVACDWLEAIA
ncbi:MAG: hypothetical protein V7L00_33125, partial [Nostoc sp.]|uniref:hypothetical protein n=1 Tax=Nostoc sp. TaxID=1180 RepID=UPI002FF54FEE